MEEKTFEELLSELEMVVKELEDKELPLDKAVENYAKGMELSKKCLEIFKHNEEFVAKIMENNQEN